MIEIITSFDQRYHDLIGKDCVNSFLEHWPEDLSITCYVEGFRLPEHPRVRQIDFDQLPAAENQRPAREDWQRKRSGSLLEGE